jgi:ABC-type oligopeptide transport system substrate-binding subunit
VAEAEFRNDVDRDRALDLVCDTTGEVDIVTEVPHAQADRVRRSRHARLVTVDAVRALAGVIDRDAEGLPLHDLRARRALNLAVDRRALVRDLFGGLARPLAGLTPPTPLTTVHRAPDRLRPYRHHPAEAARLWHAAGVAERPLRLAAMEAWEAVAHAVAAQLHEALGIRVDVHVLRGAEQEREVRRRLAGKQSRDWDVMLLEQGSQTVDVPPLELHRAFAGRSGEFRAGPVDPEFERLFAGLQGHTSQLRLVLAANRIDRYVTRQALALFLVAPHVLYAVNRDVGFTPYATSSGDTTDGEPFSVRAREGRRRGDRSRHCRSRWPSAGPRGRRRCPLAVLAGQTRPPTPTTQRVDTVSVRAPGPADATPCARGGPPWRGGDPR